MSDADREYGATPEGAGHEHTDIDPSIGYTFGVWLTISVVISAGIVYGAFMLFEGRSVEHDRTTQQFPLAAGQVKGPPTPRLQTQPFKDIHVLREAERQTLHTFGWVNQEAQTVRVPIREAMRMTIERGLPTRAEGAPASFDAVVQDSASGRTTAPR